MARPVTPLRSEKGLNRPATVKDIAEAAGVSATTVSNVLLNRAGNFSKTTSDQIKKIAKELGYRKNSLARNLVTRRSNTLGVLIEKDFNISSPDNYFFVAFVQSFMEYASAANQQVKLIQQADVTSDDVISKIDDGSIDGLVGLVLSPNNKVIPWLSDQALLPAVMVNMDTTVKTPSSLSFDDQDSMAQVARYLWDIGHRNVWYVSGVQDHPIVHDRLLGFRRVFEGRGSKMSDDQILKTKMTGENAADIIKQYLNTPTKKRPTAIACVNDLTALGIMREAEEAGLSIPGDFSLTGCDGSPQAKWVRPRLTTITQPFERFGKRAAELLVAGADGDRRIHHDSFPGELEIRESSAKVGG